MTFWLMLSLANRAATPSPMFPTSLSPARPLLVLFNVALTLGGPEDFGGIVGGGPFSDFCSPATVEDTTVLATATSSLSSADEGTVLDTALPTSLPRDPDCFEL